MKTISFYFRLFLLLPIICFLSSCGGGGSQQGQTTTDTSKRIIPLKPARPVYDAAKINPKAHVEKISLDAIGKGMTDMHYSDTILHVKSGSTVKINFRNKGIGDAMKHNFVLVYDGTREAVSTAGLKAGTDNNFVDPASTDVLVRSKVLNAGEKEEIIFPAPPAGEYEFVCTYPGHWSYMHGKFIVE